MKWDVGIVTLAEEVVYETNLDVVLAQMDQQLQELRLAKATRQVRTDICEYVGQEGQYDADEIPHPTRR